MTFWQSVVWFLFWGAFPWAGLALALLAFGVLRLLFLSIFCACEWIAGRFTKHTTN